MDYRKIRALFFLFLLGWQAASSQDSLITQAPGGGQDTAAYVSAFEEENNRCFTCHGQEKYQYMNETTGSRITNLMCENRIVRKEQFYRANHKSFACTDCHSAEYDTFPHPGNLRMEPMYNCLDCHSNDMTFAQYRFEEVDAEYQQSVHVKLESEGFTCWSCHDPHTYRITARTRGLKETVAYDNAICLQCHSNFNRFQLLTEREEINLIEKHDWLPNQASHLGSVRCIECHSGISDSLMVSHMIRPKEQAVKQCNECHSKNSLLMASLYKYESKAQRADGFFNGVIMNESYVIGANRNEYLNYISLAVLILVLAGVVVHIFLRIKYKAKH